MREREPGLLSALRSDWKANPRDPKTLIVLTGFRVTRHLIGSSRLRRLIMLPLEAIYRISTEFILGIELRPRTRVGLGLRIYHGVGLVVNDRAQVGDRVTLRNGVTIGHKVPGGGCPKIGDDVEIGANAVIIGDITIGARSIIGAGAVVTKSFPEDSVIAGNPARLLRTRMATNSTTHGS